MRQFLAVALLLWSLSTIGSAQEMVIEQSTGKKFPATVTFSHDGKEYTLTLTGVAVRKKFVFKVYGMAHYMAEPVAGKGEKAFDEILTDGIAKQITMDFARGVGSDKIQDAFREGFKENSSPEDLKKMQSQVDQFVGYFAKEVNENDQYVLRWLPGGVVIAIVQGEEKPAITGELFARTLWSIWFGEDSIVDRDDLVSRAGSK
jgi:Chalcone isomerase-like